MQANIPVFIGQGGTPAFTPTITNGRNVVQWINERITAKPEYSAFEVLIGQGEQEPDTPGNDMIYKVEYGAFRAYLSLSKLPLHYAQKKKRHQQVCQNTFQIDAFHGIGQLIHDITVVLKRAKFETTKTVEGLSAEDVFLPVFRLVQFTSRPGSRILETTVLDDSNALRLLASTKKIFIEFLQTSYSRTTNTIIDTFRWPFVVSPGVNVYETITLGAAAAKKSAGAAATTTKEVKTTVEAADDFLRAMEEARTSNIQEADRWDRCVNKAREGLNDWSAVITPLEAYNEATRRLLINEIVLNVCVFIMKTMLVEAYQCADQTHPPAHFRGTGSLDYLVGVACIETFPTAAHCRAAEDTTAEEGAAPAPLQGDDSDEEQEQETESAKVLVGLQPQDPMSTVFTSSTDVEAKQRINLAAFQQLLAQIHDKAYVSEDAIRTIANKFQPVGEVESAAEGAEGAEGKADVKVGGIAKGKKRKVEIEEVAQRQHQHLTGVLTTGHTWQFFQFTFDGDDKPDPEARMMVQYGGELKLPVLQYAVTRSSDESGATSRSSVNKDQVARVMAALVVASREVGW